MTHSFPTRRSSDLLALEQLGQFDALGPLIRPDPFEAVILGQLAAGRQRAALRRDRLDLTAERDLGVEQRDPRAAIFGAFIGEGQMLHVVSFRSTAPPTST